MRYNGNIPQKPVIKIDKVQIWVDKNSHSKLSLLRSNYPLLSCRNTHSVHIHLVPVDSSPIPGDSCGFLSHSWGFLWIPVPFLRIPVDSGHSCRNHRGKVKYCLPAQTRLCMYIFFFLLVSLILINIEYFR